MTPLTWVGFDLLFLLLLTALVGAPLAVVSLVAAALAARVPAALVWGLAPALAVLFLALLLCAVALVRLLLPRLEAGSYPFPGHRQSVAWLFHFALQRIAANPLWAHVTHSFATLRWLWLRGLGAKAAFNLQTSVDAVIIDPSLVELAEGVMLGGGAMISAHFVENDQLFLARVRLGRNVQILGGAMVSPGVTVGEGSVIGPESRLLPRVAVGAFAHLGMGCVIYGGAQIGDNAVLGHQVTIEGDAHVGEGAVVQSFARVPKGTRIADGGRFPAREERP